MSADDQFDQLVRESLRHDVPPAPVGAEQVLDDLRPRLVRSRRRRQARTAVLAAAAGLVVVIAGVLTVGGTDDQSLDVAGTVDRSTTVTTAPTTVTIPAGPDTVPDIVPGPPPTASPSTSAPSTVERPSSGGEQVTPGGPVATTAAPRPTTSTTLPLPTRRTISAPGGSIDVSSTATSITLLSVTPNPGWSIDRRDVGTASIDVRFLRDGGSSGQGSGQSRIVADIDNGSLRTRTE